MNAKKAKLLRKAILPDRAETGMSRGAFLRGLTRYEEKFRKKYVLEFPRDPDTGKEREPFEWITSTKFLDPNSPRGLYKTIKRRYLRGQS